MPTPSRPVFDPDALRDDRQLASFILTIKDKNTSNAAVNEPQNTIEYIKEPFSAVQ
jgi:hypothetical protein